MADLYALVVKDLAKESQQEKQRRMETVQSEIQQIEEKLFNVDEKFVEGNLPLDSYRRLKGRYDEEADKLRRSLTSVEAITDDAAHTVASAARALTDLPGLWMRANPTGRDTLLGSIFPEKLIYHFGSFRTSPSSSIIGLFRPYGYKNDALSYYREGIVSKGTAYGI